MSALTIIKPTDDGFVQSIGQSGKADHVSPVLNELLTEAVGDGLDTFQIPADAEFQRADGTKDTMTVGKVRRWATEKAKTVSDGGPVPDGKRVSVAGGKGGVNIMISLVDANAKGNGRNK
jgi:hypothetical protein